LTGNSRPPRARRRAYLLLFCRSNAVRPQETYVYDIAAMKLGDHREVIEVATAAEIASATLAMVGQCQHAVEIISRELDPPVYDTPQFIDMLTTLVLNRRRARIRVILFEPQAVVSRGHRLSEMAARLSTFIEMRKAGAQFHSFNQSVLIVDATGYIQRLSAERYEGKVCFHDPKTCKYLLDDFENMWSKSAPDPNLRRFNI
jgi:hypothetical protein